MTTTISAKTVSSRETSDEIYYPDGDGKPMAESDLHRAATIYGIESLQTLYADRDDVYVAGDNFVYYMRDRVRAVVSPDCYVVFGVGSQPRKSYKVWEENNRFPAFVLEITSDSTQKEDAEQKFELYQDVLGVSEYFMFDPRGDYIDNRLTGFRLTAHGYESIAPNSSGRLSSEQLGVDLFAEGSRLRFFNPTTGEILLTDKEARILAVQEAQRANQEAQRANQEAQRANQEAQRANQEAQANTVLRSQLVEAQARMEALEKQIQEATSLRQNAQIENTNNND